MRAAFTATFALFCGLAVPNGGARGFRNPGLSLLRYGSGPWGCAAVAGAAHGVTSLVAMRTAWEGTAPATRALASLSRHDLAYACLCGVAVLNCASLASLRLQGYAGPMDAESILSALAADRCGDSTLCRPDGTLAWAAHLSIFSGIIAQSVYDLQAVLMLYGEAWTLVEGMARHLTRPWPPRSARRAASASSVFRGGAGASAAAAGVTQVGCATAARVPSRRGAGATPVTGASPADGHAPVEARHALAMQMDASTTPMPAHGRLAEPVSAGLGPPVGGADAPFVSAVDASGAADARVPRAGAADATPFFACLHRASSSTGSCSSPSEADPQPSFAALELLQRLAALPRQHPELATGRGRPPPAMAELLELLRDPSLGAEDVAWAAASPDLPRGKVAAGVVLLQRRASQSVGHTALLRDPPFATLVELFAGGAAP